jgi:hypothetical protein
MQEEAHVRVTIHDLGGQSQLTIDDATLKKGLHTYNVDLETLPSGVYMLRLETPTEVLSHQLIIRK